ncbi:MAG: hypothetical protein JF606_08390 [Burkholderiales bacterium]|nr:hypothetical protein [Burkholderiales bacterium]
MGATTRHAGPADRSKNTSLDKAISLGSTRRRVLAVGKALDAQIERDIAPVPKPTKPIDGDQVRESTSVGCVSVDSAWLSFSGGPKSDPKPRGIWRSCDRPAAAAAAATTQDMCCLQRWQVPLASIVRVAIRCLQEKFDEAKLVAHRLRDPEGVCMPDDVPKGVVVDCFVGDAVRSSADSTRNIGAGGFCQIATVCLHPLPQMLPVLCEQAVAVSSTKCS